ncbi:MAG: radical SAM protein [Bryobacteraceae bacterium]
MSARFHIRRAEARGILSVTSGFIAEAGFTHSLTPARNCTYACAYCYVPTLGLYCGLQPEDWRRWGQFTTFKSNAAALLMREVRADQAIYCSPLVDPYQPAEETERQMPAVLDCLLQHPPRVFALQTRGPLVLRDLDRLVELSRRTALRVSFSLTTNREDVRRMYEPHCASFLERLDTMASLVDAGIAVYAALAPLLPCDPETLAQAALAVTRRDLIGDPLHVRAVKRRGATTREQALRISQAHGFAAWHDPKFQQEIVERIASVARAAGFRFATGPAGFAMLAAAAEGIRV